MKGRWREGRGGTERERKSVRIRRGKWEGVEGTSPGNPHRWKDAHPVLGRRGGKRKEREGRGEKGSCKGKGRHH